ncbi:hypothetical protein MC885_006674 [Smutsia gigantea]|nr:hypothetical protein MC885_006674 [Smutsia gigantea]
MSAEDENTDDRLIYEAVFSYFKRHKVEISNAIKKTFPFLECLRDREFITNKMYNDCQDSCRNLVPVHRVVYNVLSELEKTFDLSLLEAMFSEVNMQEYPDLTIQEKLHQKSEEERRVERPHDQRSMEIESCEQEPTQVNNGDARKETPSPLSWEEEKAKLPSDGIKMNSCSVHLVDVKKEKPFFNPTVERRAEARRNCNQASDIIVITSEESTESSDTDETPEICTWALQSEPVINNLNSLESNGEEETQEATCSQTQIIPEPMGFRKLPTSRKRAYKRVKRYDDSSESSGEEAPLGACSLALRSDSDEEGISSGDFSQLSNGEEPQETSSSALRSGSDTTDIGNNSTLGKHRGKRRRQPVNTGSLKRIRRRVPRIPRDKNMDFRLPELPVTCGKVKGTLHKEKMKQGVLEKCIQSEDGRWFNLREFEIEGNYASSKNWKLSLRCGGWPLKVLIEKEFLPNPPRKRKKRTPKPHNNTLVDPYPQNSNLCKVCHGTGLLFCCDTCSRSFHKECHIQPIDVHRIEAIQKKCPENQACHQEADVLKRQMLCEEQMRCEFLLLKVYSSSKSPFFAKPHYSRETSQDPKKPMWLNKIKKKLKKKLYPQVQGFVRDMRLIFQNHRTLYRNKSKFIMLGLQLEVEFENNFRNIFAIQERSKDSSSCKPTLP